MWIAHVLVAFVVLSLALSMVASPPPPRRRYRDPSVVLADTRRPVTEIADVWRCAVL